MGRMPAEFHVYTLHDGAGGTRHVLSLLSPEDLRGRPLPDAAVMGAFTGEPDALEPGRFTCNSTFAAFLQWVVANHAPATPELQARCRELGDGHVAVVDARTRGGPFSVPQEDIIGTFEVRAGEPVGYRPNPAHLLLTEHGPWELDPPLLSALLRELRELVDAEG